MEKTRWFLIMAALLTDLRISENFEVISPQSITGLVGKDTVLLCQISSTKPLDSIEVQWKKITAGQMETVHLYKQQSGDIPGPKYAGRTALPKDGFASGNVSLVLKRVQPADEGTYSCIVKSRDWSADNTTTLITAGAAFPQTSPWLFAFWILLVIFLLSIAATAFMVFKEKRKTSDEETAEEENLNKQHALRRELDFRKARSYMVVITLDKMQKHSELTISSDQRTVYHESPAREPAVEHQLPIVVAKEGFSCGRQYWEVQVWDGLDWEVGLMTESVRQGLKEGSWQDLPEHGVWSLKRNNEEFWPEEANTVIQERTEKPSLVGVDLDLSEHELSFYDAAVSASILKVPIEGSTQFYPFLRPGLAEAGGKGKPLSINSDTSWDFPQTFKTNKRYLADAFWSLSIAVMMENMLSAREKVMEYRIKAKDTVTLTCVVPPDTPVTRAFFCRDGKEIVVLAKDKSKFFFEYTWQATLQSTGTYFCHYQHKDEQNQERNSLPSNPRFLEVTAQGTCKHSLAEIG
ncbi:PREDICTED: butyrophilin-like protein 8, partial [Tinamus guttatus]|uniref:butyrophilin-like protein 8 n=1 Tax=Tinamus guttatus TaxID=94827 RepID=UPI00052E6E96